MNFNTIARSRYCLNNTRGIPSLAVMSVNVVVTIAFWMELKRTRGFLEKLTAAELRDIGITREDALREARRPFYEGG